MGWRNAPEWGGDFIGIRKKPLTLDVIKRVFAKAVMARETKSGRKA